MLTLLLAGALLLPAAPQQQRTDTTFSAEGLRTLSVENPNGATIVRGWQREQVRVRATSRAARDIEIDRDRRGITIEASGRGTVQLEIDLPARMAVAIEGTNQSVDVQDVMAPLEVESVNGEINVRGGRGAIQLETVQGRITVDGASGQIEASSTNNTVQIRNSSGDIDAETVNGAILLDGVRASRVSASTVNGALRFEGPLARDGHYAFSSHNGTIELHVPASSSATFEVSTFNGEFEVDFPVQLRDREARGQYQFRLGDGNAHVELESFSGDVRVLRTR